MDARRGELNDGIGGERSTNERGGHPSDSGGGVGGNVYRGPLHHRGWGKGATTTITSKQMMLLEMKLRRDVLELKLARPWSSRSKLGQSSILRHGVGKSK